MPEANRILDIYVHLEDSGIEVYLPGQHIGEVKTNYVVLKDEGTQQFREYTSTQSFVDLICYVPQNKYSELITFMDEVKEIMKDMYPMVKPTYNETPTFFDDVVKGWSISIEYMYFRKIERRRRA